MGTVNLLVGTAIRFISLFVVWATNHIFSVYGGESLPTIAINIAIIAPAIVWGAIIGWLWYFSNKLSANKKFAIKGAIIAYLAYGIAIYSILTLLLNLSCGASSSMECDLLVAYIFGYVNLIVLAIFIVLGVLLGRSYGKKINDITISNEIKEGDYFYFKIKTFLLWVCVAVIIATIGSTFVIFSGKSKIKNDLTIVGQAVNENNPMLCEQLVNDGNPTDYKSDCYYQVAINNKNLEACKNFIIGGVDRCYLDVSMRYDDRTICQQITNPDLKNQCLTLENNWNKR